jgi:3-methyl-2-oxobutanoate hydroxymethyltransferase
MSTQLASVTTLEDRTKRVTTQTLQEMRRAGTRIAMLTAYDFTSARILDGAGVDVLLVGDSASNVMAGNETTLPITLEHMIYHAQCVVRGVQRALVVVDLPFGAYQGNSKEALHSAVRVMKETGAHAVKLEGGQVALEAIERILSAGIPVMGHLGLTPQSIYKFGTYRVRAREEDEAEQVRQDAKLLEEAGCFAIVLEKIPASLAADITGSVSIPTIGIGAGGACSGQVLVTHDMLGLTKDFNPRFVRRYLDLADTIGDAVGAYIEDVRSGEFPTEDESY